MNVAATLSRLLRWYTRAAITLFTVAMVFFGLNFVMSIVLRFGSKSEFDRTDSPLPPTSLKSFRSAPDQCPWPMDSMDYNVLFFGGSTAEGNGASDDQTISAQFQTFLQGQAGQRVCCYNFARPGYNTTQERILFEQLLQNGARPNMVVFIDGVNDFVSAASSEATTLDEGRDFIGGLTALPLVQAVRLFSNRIAKSDTSSPDFRIVDSNAITRYIFNKTAIESVARIYDISTVFVFQPTSVYPDDPNVQRTDSSQPGDQLVAHGYRLMSAYAKDNKMGDDFLWLAEVHNSARAPLYLDKWHYNAEFARQIAARIYEFTQTTFEPTQQVQIGEAK
jgi:hypothetical protein